MAVYIDNPCSYSVGIFSHMAADTIGELHEFANKIGINKCWFSNKRNKHQPHYDVAKRHFDDCIKHGAINVTKPDLFIFLKKTYGNILD